MLRTARRSRTRTRRQLAGRSGHDSGHYGRARARSGYQRMEQEGLVCGMPPDGPAHERLAWVPATAPVGRIVAAVSSRGGEFRIEELERDLGRPVSSPETLDRLGRAGLAIVSNPSPGSVLLLPASPDVAQITNRSRLGCAKKGYSYRRLAQAFTPGRPTGRITDDRRLEIAEEMEKLDLDASEILDGRRFVHVRSKWRMPEGNGKTAHPVSAER